jgi:hypothetical protein
MLLSRVLIVGVLWAGCLSAQAYYKLYVLHNSLGDDQWCGYQSREKFQSEIGARNAPEVATLTYKKKKLAVINFNYVDESGDWAADETYRLDGKTHLVLMDRIIGVRDGQSKESWLIKDGEARKQPFTGPMPNLDFVPDLSIVTDLKAFAFWPLIRDHQGEIRSKGEFCTAKGEPPLVPNSRLWIALEADGKWCGFSDRYHDAHLFESLAAKPPIWGRLDFADERLVSIMLMHDDKLHHWTVDDSYGLDRGQNLRTAVRDVLGDADWHDSWLIQNGKLAKQEGTFSPGTPKVDITKPPYPTIQTSLSGFDFWPLIRDERSAILSSGRLCK